MKKFLTLTTLTAILTTSVYAGHFFGHHEHYKHYSNHVNHASQIINSNIQTAIELTQKQKDDLIFIYQEEKLARDVYTALEKIYNLRVFRKVKRSEQKHMNAVKNLLESYNIPVPVLSDDIGVFENEELQALYDELLEKGKQSRQDALEVGVAVEETDIADLEEKMEGAPSDVQRVFKNLLRGSNNHLRAFNANLRRY